jgi:hypothetical protein
MHSHADRIVKAALVLALLMSCLPSMAACNGIQEDDWPKPPDTSRDAQPDGGVAVLNNGLIYYDPSNEDFYFLPEGKTTYDEASGQTTTSKGWSNDDVYLHEVTKPALVELIQLNLDAAENAAEDFSSMSPLSEYYSEFWHRRWTKIAAGLKPLLKKVEATDENDNDALQSEYEEFHDAIGITSSLD